MKRYHIIFKGRVQGVGFRYTSKRIADRYGLTGTVKNLYDGNVECFIQGEEKDIDEFIEELNNQSYIRIESMDKSEVDIKDNESSYNIIG